MDIQGHSLFEQHYVPLRKSTATAPESQSSIQVLHSRDLPSDLGKWLKDGFLLIGTAEFVGRGNQGVGREARAQAAVVGASVVLFRPTPARLKAIRRNSDGTIDLEAVLAAPPTTLSARGHYVVQAMFLSNNPNVV